MTQDSARPGGATLAGGMLAGGTPAGEPRPPKVVVVGAGQVGSTFAYAMLLEGVVGEIVLGID